MKNVRLREVVPHSLKALQVIKDEFSACPLYHLGSHYSQNQTAGPRLLCPEENKNNDNKKKGEQHFPGLDLFPSPGSVPNQYSLPPFSITSDY